MTTPYQNVVSSIDGEIKALRAKRTAARKAKSAMNVGYSKLLKLAEKANKVGGMDMHITNPSFNYGIGFYMSIHGVEAFIGGDLLKAQLIEAGEGPHEGILFKATIVTQFRETLDMKAVREYLSPQFISAHTKVTPVTSVKVTSR